MSNELNFVWVFNGEGGKFPSGIFLSAGVAEDWIRKHRLNGVLTKYPVDVGVFDWAVSNGMFTPKDDRQRSAEFVGRFSSASQDHWHYEDGEKA